jgi:hypothetical protein
MGLPKGKHIGLPKGKHIGLPKGKHIGLYWFAKEQAHYSIPDKYLGRSPNFSLDVQDKSWTPDPISFSETL